MASKSHPAALTDGSTRLTERQTSFLALLIDGGKIAPGRRPSDTALTEQTVRRSARITTLDYGPMDQ
ncbi:hypothetical protein V5799_025453 [Amblyomma americanum]|uniref:Uncharacterized protein n=1 Tax=Amblyomma americanum TaxID=6943 RepID=A0AAQ4E962_AMBAM